MFYAKNRPTAPIDNLGRTGQGPDNRVRFSPCWRDPVAQGCAGENDTLVGPFILIDVNV